MADYEGRIRVGVENLGQLRQLERTLENAANLFERLEQAGVNAGQIAQSGQRNVNAAVQRRINAQERLKRAERTVENVAMRRDPETGRFMRGGPNATARRLASSRLRLAQREVRESSRNLEEELQNQRLINRAQGRYQRALNRTTRAIGAVQARAEDAQARADTAMRDIGKRSRENYLTNLFQGRQRALQRGGGGRELSAELRKQIQNNRSAFDLASAAQNRPLMAKLATELAGLVRQQNEVNQLRAGRSVSFEAGRRGQERITELAKMPGADPARIRRLRSRATEVISAGYAEDIAGARDLTRRMNGAISRYARELNAAAKELKEARARGGPSMPIRGKATIAGSPAALERSARMGGPRESIRGRKDLPGSPAYYQEQQKQLQKAIRIGGPSMPIRGGVNIPGSPAALERARRLGGPRESVRGRKDLPGSPAYLEEQRRQQSQRLQRAIRAGGPREPIGGRKDLIGSPAYYEEQERQLQKAVQAGGPRESIKGRKDLPGSPAYYEEQRKQLERAAKAGGPSLPIRGAATIPGSPAAIARSARAGGPRESIRGRRDLPGSPLYLEEQQKRLKQEERRKQQEERRQERDRRIESIRQEKARIKDFNVRQSWRILAAEEQQRAEQNKRALPDKRLLAERIAGTVGGVAPTRLDQLKKDEEKRLRDEEKELEKKRKRWNYNKKLKAEEERQARLGIGVVEPMRIGGTTRRVSAVAMAGGIDSGVNPKALPNSQILSERIARAGAAQPLRLDELKAAEEKRLAQQAKDAAGSVGRFAAALEREEKRLQALGIGGPARNTRGAVPMGGTAAPFRSQADIRSGLGELNRQEGWKRFLQEDAPRERQRLQDNIERQRQQDERRRQQEERRRQQEERQRQQKALFRGDLRKAVGEGLIGGAFPLLFGQGAGASAGGLVGGFTGGMIGGSFGFGLSLIGTALGQAVDNASNNLKELAASLKSPSDAITALEASGFRVSDSIKFQVQQLQSVGRAYDAQTLVLAEVQKRLGPGSITELNQLDSAQKRLQEQWAAIAAEIQVRLLPVLQGFVEFLGSAAGDIGGFASQSRLQRIDPNKFAQLRDQAIRETAKGPFGSFGDKKAFDARLNQLSQQELSRRFANERGSVKLSAQDAAANAETQIQESRKLADQVRSAYREAFNLQRQAYDLQREGADINREIADYAYRKEQQIFDLRQQASEKEIENRRSAAQNRIESGDLNLRQAFANASGFEQQLLNNVREAMRTRKEGEADIEQSRKRLELAMAKLSRDAEDYKRTTSREIDDIERRKLAYARSVEDYKMQVADYVLQRSRESADLMRQAMTLPEVGSGAGGGAAPAKAGAGTRQKALPTGTAPSTLIGVPGVIEYLTGDKGSPGYRADHGGSNYHEHIAFASRKIRDDVISMLRRNGIAIGSTDGGRHAPGSYHYSGQAVDIPAAQVPVGQEDALARRVRALVAAHLGGSAAPSVQAQAASQVGNVRRPRFTPAPIGATPAGAPINSARMAVLSRMAGNEQDALKILENEIKLRQKGVELGQIEQILQNNQLPQLEQEGEALRRQVEARKAILDLSDKGASVVDIEAEAQSRLTQILKDRRNALAEVQRKITDPKDQLEAIRQINQQAGAAIGIAAGEEEQRRKNLALANELQTQDRVRAEILRLQEDLLVAQVEASSLERGALEAKNSELLKASTLYRDADDAQRARLEALTVETEELQKQNELRKQANERRLVGAGLRAGLIGTGARAFEQGLRDFNGDSSKAMQAANQAKALEDQQLVWGRLEQNITDVSEAISGGLTNGLLDIIDGSRKIEDVGREMLRGIANTFAESAQQQLSTLMQRQLAGMLGGSQGPLVKMLGGAGEAAGSQSLGAASMAASSSVWGLSGAAVAASAALQSIAAQSVISGAMGGFGGAFPAAASGALRGFASGLDLMPNLPVFGGFMANGGTTIPGEGYVVGEREPEFFFPGVTGRIVPQSDMQKAAALQQADRRSEPIKIEYDVTEHQGERYVTERQFREGMAASTKRAQAMTYAGMRNSKDIRNYVAI